MIRSAKIRAIDTGNDSWYEIDTPQDLDIAEAIFANSGKFELVQARYGGLWRFPKLLDYTFLVNPFFPRQELLSELQAGFGDFVSNYPSGLRIQNLLAASLVECDSSQIVVGNGASELIPRVLASVGKRIGVVCPIFEEFLKAPESAEIFPFYCEKYNLNLDTAAATRWAINERLSALVLVNPNNPTGILVPKEKMIEMARNLSKSGIRLVVDESFADFSNVEGQSAGMLEDTLLNELKNLTVIKSIGKSHGIGVDCAPALDRLAADFYALG